MLLPELSECAAPLRLEVTPEGAFTLRDHSERHVFQGAHERAGGTAGGAAGSGSGGTA